MDDHIELPFQSHLDQILHGREDRLLPVAGSRRLAARIPGSQLVELDRVGHEFRLSQLGRFLEPLRTHLEAVRGAPL
ncbi:MAG: hypothetical protein KC910_00445 [Candidatus Eremiobacteraeota bacterium]|nr:hypothetical protein [Candidatus Eremiobacteraeota bacterium]